MDALIVITYIMEWGAEQTISIEIKILVMKSIYYIMVTHIVNPELDQPNITPFYVSGVRIQFHHLNHFKM